MPDPVTIYTLPTPEPSAPNSVFSPPELSPAAPLAIYATPTLGSRTVPRIYAEPTYGAPASLRRGSSNSEIVYSAATSGVAGNLLSVEVVPDSLSPTLAVSLITGLPAIRASTSAIFTSVTVGSTITIGGVVFTAVASAPGARQFINTSASSLAAAVNADAEVAVTATSGLGLTLIAKVAGAAGNSITVEPSSLFAFGMSNGADAAILPAPRLRVNLEINPSGYAASTANQVIAAIAASAEVSEFYRAALGVGNGTGLSSFSFATNLSGGVDAVPPAVLFSAPSAEPDAPGEIYAAPSADPDAPGEIYAAPSADPAAPKTIYTLPTHSPSAPPVITA